MQPTVPILEKDNLAKFFGLKIPPNSASFYHFKAFVRVPLLDLHRKLLQVRSWCPFPRAGNAGLRSSGDLPRVTELVSEDPGTDLAALTPDLTLCPIPPAASRETAARGDRNQETLTAGEANGFSRPVDTSASKI